jgi:hypothetical protein
MQGFRPRLWARDAKLTNDEQWLTKFDRLTVLNQYLLDHASGIRFDLVE